ncbi:MAG: carbohydrate deacetylase [Erysipelotrichaceae bacterium]|nr:carbohydrate deacetylase [Erysipelotrichaceae bacterium]
MKLIMNADDYGLTKGVSLGIIEACKRGLVRSTTVLMNSPHMEEYALLAKECSELGIGIHLNLTIRKPLTSCKTLVDDQGNFYRKPELVFTDKVDYEEVYQEWKAQIEKFIEVFHQLPTHIDSHHHVHDYNEQAFEVSSRLAKEYGLVMRRHCDFEHVKGFYGDISKEVLLDLLMKYQDKDIEIMCHPAFVDLDLYRMSSYSIPRIKELAVICDPEVIAFCEAHSIELTHF